MSRYLDTRGRSILSVAICARCGIKFPRDELVYDKNYPGLVVCKDDADDLDPYRLPPRQADQVNITDPRPDVALYPGPYDVPVPQQIQPVLGADMSVVVTNAGQGIALAPPASPLSVPVGWQPLSSYTQGNQVTPIPPNAPTSPGQIIYVFTCLIPGQSGGVAPVWTTNTGTLVMDGSVLWINGGLWLE